jgi:FtsP/CotA-like multicopper oxidase with cupredoxin domain
MTLYFFKKTAYSIAISVGMLLTGLLFPLCAKGQFVTRLLIPDTVSTADHDTIHLKMIQSQRVFFPGATTSVTPGYPAFFVGDTLPVATLSYIEASKDPAKAPGVLGPTLIWWKGDSVTMLVENKIGHETTNHWHGAHVAPKNDGGPHKEIANDEIWAPSFRIDDQSATMWYHPHLHHHTNEHTSKGLAGLIIVKDAADPFRTILPHRYGVDDIPLILQDKFFGRDLVNKKDTINTTCEMGTTFFVNGTWRPYVNVPAQPVRFRFLNGSGERTYCIFLRDSTAHEWVTFKVIASDAGYLGSPYTMGVPPKVAGDMNSLLIMMPGERYEIVFDGAGRENHQLFLMNMRNLMTGNHQIRSFAGGPSREGPPCYTNLISNPTNPGMLPDSLFDATPLALMQINIKAADGKAGSVPSSFAPYAYKPITAPVNVVRNKRLIFNLAFQPPFSIDDVEFDLNKINDTIILGDVERWKITNNSFAAHPFHIHDVHFFIESMTDLTGKPIPIPTYMQGPKDVEVIPDSSIVTFTTQFTDFATSIDPENSYMYHCHILGHEDGGMMHQFVVTTPKFGGVGIKEEQQLAKWNIYPNPATNTISVEIPENTNGTLQLFDLMGRKIQEWQTNETYLKLDVSKVNNGMYLLQWENAGVTSSRRISILK